MLVKSWKRDCCRLCGSLRLQIVLPLKAVPIGEKYSLEPKASLDTDINRSIRMPRLFMRADIRWG